MTTTQTITTDFLLPNNVYLLNHSVGRPLTTAKQNLEDLFFTAWEGGEPWGKWMQAFGNFQQALANLLNSQANNFCPQVNLSSAFTKILYALPKRNGKQSILLSENDFPTIGFVAEQAKSLGYELVFLPKNVDETNPQVWFDAMKSDVQWVHITQVQSNTGLQIPIKEIVAEANKRNIISVVDIAQSAGILPINIDEWQANFVIGSCVKWLCGGAGAGFLWVNSTILQECKPVDVGWFSHENPFEFNIHNFVYHPTALHFWGGTPSVMPYVVASHSINYFANLGIEKVREHNVMLSQQILDNLDKKFIVSPLETHKRSGTMILNFGEKQQDVVNLLKSNGILFDVRHLGMRLSPHIYNTTEDMTKVIVEIEKVI
jgi:selenocysteine lyase/cysteine desulfurase